MSPSRDGSDGLDSDRDHGLKALGLCAAKRGKEVKPESLSFYKTSKDNGNTKFDFLEMSDR